MESPTQKRLAEIMRQLSQLYRDVEDHKVSQEEARIRLSVLKVEQQRIQELHEAEEATQGDEMMRRFKRARRAYHAEHPLDFKCQCKSCVRKHTITLKDRDFLKELKITWGKTSEEIESFPQS